MSVATELINQLNAKEYDKLEKTLHQLTSSSLLQMLHDTLAGNVNGEAINLLKAVFLGCGKSALKHSKTILDVYKHCINVLKSKDGDDTFHNELICLLNVEANNLSSKNLVELCVFMLNMIQDDDIGEGKWLQVFQKILDVVQQHASVKYGKSETTVTGSEYKHYVIQEICLYKWPRNHIIHLVNTVRQLQLTAHELDVVVFKLLEQLNDIDIQELPPIVFQILVLGSDCNKLPCVLWGILNHFNDLYHKCVEEEELMRNDAIDSSQNVGISIRQLRSTEGTVLLYFSNALRQHPSLGKGLLKMFKNAKQYLSPDVITPFFFALGLVLLQDSRFFEEAQNLLNLLICRCFQDQHKIKNCKFLKECADDFPDMNKIILNMVTYCQQGWQHVISGLVDFGFSLMSSFGPKQGPFKKTMEKKIKKRDIPQASALNVGIQILTRTFKMHKPARNEIMVQLLNRIQASVNTPAYHYIALLKLMLKYHPQTSLQCVSQIKIMLDDLMVIHPYNVQKVISALIPLLKISATLKNSLILILRKALSARHTNCRLSAVGGFLLLLEHFPLDESTCLSQVSSQSSQSIFSSSSTQTDVFVHNSSQGKLPNRMLCLEVLQALKRCLLQQGFIRTELYIGLYDVISCNIRLCPFVMENLIDQLKLYYDEEPDIIPPLKLNKCISKNDGSIDEPLSVLLSFMHQCLHKAQMTSSSRGVDNDEIIDELLSNRVTEIFKSLTTRLSKCELDDFNIDGSSLSSSRSDQASLAICQLLCVYEVLMEYNYFNFKSTNEGIEEILCLFQCYKKIYDSTFGLKSSQFSGKLLLQTRLSSSSLMFLSDIVQTLFCEDDSDVRDLISNDNLLKHIMSSLHSMLLHAKDHGYFPGFGGSKNSDSLQYVTRAIHACLHKYMVEKNDPERSPITYQCIECFHAAVQYVSSWHGKQLYTFLAGVCGDDDDEDNAQESAIKLIKRMQRLVVPFISVEQPLSALQKKILSELLSLLETLITLTLSHFDNSTMQQHTEWWRKICIENDIEDTTSVKRVVQTHLQTSTFIITHPELCFRDLCIDIRTNIGSIDTVNASQGNKTYQIVSADNGHQLITVAAKHLGNIINETEWLLQHIKGRVMFHGINKESDTSENTDDIHEKRRKCENSICVRICTVAVGLLELSLTATNTTTSIDSILHAFTAVFTFIANLSKYYLWIYSQGHGIIPSRFERLIQFIGSELMQPIYGFIMHAQIVQTEKLDINKVHKESTKTTSKPDNCKISTAGKAKVLRDTKGIADLVYAIEQHEHHLILLGRKSKLDFMKSYHLPTSRDFRIRSDLLHSSLTNNEKENCSDNESADDEPVSKRTRVCA